MNRTILTAIWLMAVSAVPASAEQITTDEARSIATRFFDNGQDLTKSTAAVSLSYTQADSRNPAYYVFSHDNGRGFVVVSGDDRMPQIVGYSHHNPFDADRMPDGLKAFFANYASVVDAVREGTAYPATETGGGVAIGPLMTVQWDQDAPFNDKCPEIKSQRAATGCVATAMAQVMKYHAYPSQGYGKVTWEKENFDLSQSVYDWTLMPDRYISGRYTTTEADQVAQLMLDCGHAVQMKYGRESGALTEYVAPAFVKHFGYSECIQYQMRSSWTDSGWIGLIRANLSENLPVIYGGDGLQGGHQFICDGIDTADRLHINWGWSGLSDGFYDMNALSPDDVGIGGNAISFNEYQDIVCWIRPLSESDRVPATWSPHLALGYMEIETKTDDNGRYQTTSKLNPTIRASVEIDNATGGRVEFKYGYIIYNAAGNEVARSVTRTSSFSDAGYYLPDVTITVALKGLTPGKYHISWRWQNTEIGASPELQAFWAGDLAEGFWIEVRDDGYYAVNGDGAGIDGVAADTSSWKLTAAAGGFVLTGAPAGSDVRVYSAQGSLVATATASDDDTFIDMSGNRNGLYIIAVTAPDGTSQSFKSIFRD